MNNRKVLILLYNDAVQFPSFDVKCLHGAMVKMCEAINVPGPLSYEQVTRLMKEKCFFIHTPALGHQWQIIERELLYTRRKKRQPVQRLTEPEINSLNPNQQ